MGLFSTELAENCSETQQKQTGPSPTGGDDTRLGTLPRTPHAAEGPHIHQAARAHPDGQETNACELPSPAAAGDGTTTDRTGRADQAGWQ